MRGTLNAHKVLKGTLLRPGYIKALDIEEAPERGLREARDDIRQALRQGFPEWARIAKTSGLIEQRFLTFAETLPPLRPRFRMQGSAVYHTLNNPAHKPPQEVDFDDGVFLPTSFVSGGGTLQPIIAAKGYFKAVETILQPLCQQKGWVLNKSKPTCVRVRITNGAHIDLPLYAIPDHQFLNLVEASARRALRGTMQSPEDMILAESVYKGLSKDDIMLARRDTGWIESDPREIEDWFLAAISEHGEVVRRICRYLKGWRDFQWHKGGPSSITLMACVITVFDELKGSLPDNRDDLALQEVAGKLPALFAANIPNPVIPDQNLDEKWTPEQRLDYRSRADALKISIDSALNSTYHKPLALSHFAKVFGDRIPEDDALIEIDSAEREVLDYKPAAVAAPFVPRTTSG